MSSPSLNHNPSTTMSHSYAANVGQAARSLFAALLAVDAKPAAVADEAPSRRSGRRELYRLARQYEAVEPNLASELRYLASR